MWQVYISCGWKHASVKDEILQLQDEGVYVLQHLNLYTRLIVDVRSVGIEIDDEDIDVILLKSLPKSYRPWVEFLFNGSDPIKYHMITYKLNREFWLLDNEASDDQRSEVLTAKSSNRER